MNDKGNQSPSAYPSYAVPGSVSRMAAVWAGVLTLITILFDWFVIASEVLPAVVLNFDSIYLIVASGLYIWLFNQRFRPGVKELVIGFNIYVIIFMILYVCGIWFLLYLVPLGQALLTKLGANPTHQDALAGIMLQTVMGKLILLMVMILLAAGLKWLTIRLAR